MKTLTTIVAATIFLATSSFAGNNDKFYEVTDNGKFQYEYWRVNESNTTKAGIKPVTVRTFYLETVKYGVIPQDMSYRDFLDLTIQEKQAIVQNSQYQIISMKSNGLPVFEKIEVDRTTAIDAQEANLKPRGMVDEPTSKIDDEKNSVSENDVVLPWTVRAVTIAGTEDNFNKEGFNGEEEQENFSWVADIVTTHGKKINQKIIEAEIAPSKDLTVNK